MDWLEPADWASWRLRVRLEHAAGNLTRARRDALQALLGLLCTGDAEPSDADVAEVARCSARTVRRARADARALGLLGWERTRRLVAGAWRQGRNRYWTRVPDGPVCPRRTERPRVREDKKKEAWRGTIRPAELDRAAAIAALAAIRERRAAALGLVR